MQNYVFKTREFAVSNEGIHLIRNGFNYKTYTHGDITSFNIRRGREVKNWILLLFIGVGLIVSGLWYLWSWSGSLPVLRPRALWLLIMLPLSAFGFGGYCVYSSLCSATVLTFTTADNKTNFVSLRQIESDGKLAELREFLDGRRTSR